MTFSATACWYVTLVTFLQEYVRQIGSCLLQLSHAASSDAPTTVQSATGSMQRLTVEAADVCACLLQDPVANKAIITSRLDEGATDTHSLDREFYINLVVSIHKHEHCLLPLKLVGKFPAAATLHD